MQPTNYLLRNASPVEAINQGIEEQLAQQASRQTMGLRTEANVRANAQEARAAEMHPLRMQTAESNLETAALGREETRLRVDEANRARERRAAFQDAFARLAELGTKATMEDFAEVSLQFPEFNRAISESMGMMTEARQRGMATRAAKVLTAIQAGDQDLAIQLSEEYAQAAENSGDIQLAQVTRSISELMKTDPRLAYAPLGMMLADNAKDIAEQIFPKREKPTAAEAEVQRLVGIGIPYDVAVKLNAGVLEAREDPTGGVVVVDKSTGEVVHTINPTKAAGAGTPPITGDSATTFEPVTIPEQEAPEISNAGEAFGFEGWVKNLANSASDYFGAGTPYEGVRDTRSFFNVLSEQLTNGIAMTYGRQPTGARMDAIQALGALPAGGQGEETAKSNLRALKRSFESDLRRLTKQSSRKMRQPERDKINQMLVNVQAMIGRVDEALAAFGAEERKSTKTGIEWSIER